MNEFPSVRPNEGETRIPLITLTGIDPYLPLAEMQRIHRRCKEAQAARKNSPVKELLLQKLLYQLVPPELNV